MTVIAQAQKIAAHGKNPIAVFAIIIATAINMGGVFLGSWLFLEGHFLTQSAYAAGNETQQRQQRELSKSVMYTQLSIAELRWDRATDELSKLRAKPVVERTDYEKVRIEQLPFKINKIEKDLDRINASINKLEES